MEILHHSKITTTQVLILVLAFVSMMLDGLDVMIIAFAAPAISSEFAFSSEQMGYIFSSALMGMAIGAMVFSSYADVCGRRIIISVALLIAGIATTAFFFANSALSMMVLRFIAGLGLGTFVAVLPSLGGEFSPLKYRNVILSILIAGISIGSIMGGIIVAWILPIMGWRNLFLCTGLATSIFAALFYYIVPEPIQFLISQNKQNALHKVNKTLLYLKQPTVLSLPIKTAATPVSAGVKSLLTDSNRRNTLLLWSVFLTIFSTIFFVGSWLPKLLTDAGIPIAFAIRAAVLVNIGAVIGGIIIGFVSRWFTLTRLISSCFAIATLLMIALCIAIKNIVETDFLIIYILTFSIGLTLNGGFANLFSVALSIYPVNIRNTGLGWCVGLGRGGAILSPSIAGILLVIGVSPSNLIAIFSATVALGAILICFVDARKTLPD